MQTIPIGKFISEKMTSFCLFLIFLSGFFYNNKSCRIAFITCISFMIVVTLFEKFNTPDNVKITSPVFEVLLFGTMFGMLIFQPQYFYESLLIFVLLILN